MAPTVVDSGTQTAIVGTEHTLEDIASASTIVATFNLKNMVTGDTVELRVYNKTLTGDTITAGSTTTLAYLATYAHVQGEPVVATVPVTVGYAAKVTLKQTAGTARNFDWNVLSL